MFRNGLRLTPPPPSPTPVTHSASGAPTTLLTHLPGTQRPRISCTNRPIRSSGQQPAGERPGPTSAHRAAHRPAHRAAHSSPRSPRLARGLAAPPPPRAHEDAQFAPCRGVLFHVIGVLWS